MPAVPTAVDVVLPLCRGLSLLSLLSAALGAQGASGALPASSEREFVPLWGPGSTESWVTERRSPEQQRPPETVLLVTERGGLVRTARSEFGTFVLRFDARSKEPDTRAVFVMFGASPRGSSDGSGYGIRLFGDTMPGRDAFPQLLLMVLPTSAAGMVEGALRPRDQWQSYEIVRRESVIEMTVNDRKIIAQEGPRTIDGWLGFRTQSADLELRNIRLGPAQPEAASTVYRIGSGVTAPRVVREQRPNYTAEALAARIEGTVLVECVVGTDGLVSRVVVARSLDQQFGLDEAAVRAARQWRFLPGTRMGLPVPVLVNIELTFAVKK